MTEVNTWLARHYLFIFSDIVSLKTFNPSIIGVWRRIKFFFSSHLKIRAINLFVSVNHVVAGF